MRAKLCHFYGLKLWEVKRLNSRDANVLWQAITVIEARMLLNLADVISIPHSKKEMSSKILKTLQDQANPVRDPKKRQMKVKDLARRLSRG
jgi:hypothetical protein